MGPDKNKHLKENNSLVFLARVNFPAERFSHDVQIKAFQKTPVRALLKLNRNLTGDPSQWPRIRFPELGRREGQYEYGVPTMNNYSVRWTP